ncbi:Aste57867_23141 [Aphanomyces stellatus]|uniref:Aste57867_23141 protein n=1 Tax=Aphanomyces stellatus TaxID=120398 RepID=A0A485LMD1_9STRA|nr:hypothetical protein As57867_023070 [Aphanomyces stellatus]VFT99789.1 Aste57867_23141 [Aphanomyces stellatus]
MQAHSSSATSNKTSSGNSSSNSSSDNASSSSDGDSSLSSSDDDDDDDDVDIVAQLQDKFKQGLVHLVGTRESRFANRTSPALKWKEEVAYAMAEAAYVAEKDAAIVAAEAARQERKLERRRRRKTRVQDNVNRKVEKRMARKVVECNTNAAKLEQKMTILAELRLERLGQVRAKAVKVDPPWMSGAERDHRETLQAFTAAEDAKHKAMIESWGVADEMGRKVGVLPAIGTPPKKKHDEQSETTTALVLRLAELPHEADASKPKEGEKAAARHRTLFTINLKRFRHVEQCHGDKIGERGCVEFGKSLLTGACPRLKELNLGWNAIKYRGMASLALAFERGAGSALVHLDLRSNGLDATALKTLFGAMEAGGVPELQRLVLCGNVLGDAGGKAIAHAFLKGLFATIACVDVKSNAIRNDGCRAMFTAFTADCFTRLAPKFELLDMRRNCINQATADTFVPCPKYIAF